MNKGYIFLCLLWSCCAQYINTNNPVFNLGDISLTAIINSSNSWDMSSLFTIDNTGVSEIARKKITSFLIEGNSPCIIQDPSLMAAISFIHREKKIISDFATVGVFLYYVTDNGVYRMYLNAKNQSESIVKLADSTQYAFTYIEGFRLSDSKILLMFRNASAYFSYAVLPDYVVTTIDIKTLPKAIEEFTDDMKVTLSNDLIFIPAQSKGLYVYSYDEKKMELIYEKTFAESIKVRDITVRYNAPVNYIVGYISNYEEGILPFQFNGLSLEMDLGEVIEEFVNAKMLRWVFDGLDHKLLIILDGLHDSSKVVILSIKLSDLKALRYDAIKLLDGVSRYGDVDERYASVVMANSIFLTEISKKTDNMYKYVNVQGVSHAKMHQTVEASFLIYIDQNRLVGDYLFWNDGFLMCDIDREITEQYFAILGHSDYCGVDEAHRPIKSCYYRLGISLDLAKISFKQSIDEMRVMRVIIIITTFIVFFMLTVGCVLLVRVYRTASSKLAEYRRLEADTFQTDKKIVKPEAKVSKDA